MPVPFHLDENLTSRIATSLRSRDIDCTTSKDADLLSHVDDDQLAYAIETGRVLITRDSDFVGIHSRVLDQNKHHPGIIYWANRKKHFGTIVKEIDAMALEMTDEEFRDRLIFL